MWKISPKTGNSSSTIIKIVAIVAACVLSEGTLALLIVMNVLAINFGPDTYRYTEKTDFVHAMVANKRDTRNETNENI